MGSKGVMFFKVQRGCWGFWGLMLVLCAASACGPKDEVVPDISGIKVQLLIQRFEVDLKDASLDTLGNGAETLRQQHPVFFDSVWLELMVPGRGAQYDSALVAAFRKQPVLQRLLDSVLLAYPPDASLPWTSDLREAFRYAKHYFPQQPTPTVITYLSELSLGAFTYGDRFLGIGLDFHLGAGFPGYDPNVFPRYIQRSMNTNHVASRAIEAWVSGLMGEAPGEQMLEQMLHNGKLLYIKERLLPHVADTAVLGFSESQLQWLKDNEAQLWAHYLDEELLYETKPSRIGKHIGPSPNAPGMPPEAPGRNANWMGMRIVEQLVRRRPNLTLTELLELRDSQLLLTQSKYKPPR